MPTKGSKDQSNLHSTVLLKYTSGITRIRPPGLDLARTTLALIIYAVPGLLGVSISDDVLDSGKETS